MPVTGPNYKVVDGSINSPSSGSVGGPVSSTDTAIAKWSGTDGDSLIDTSILVDASQNVSGMGTLGCGAITSTGESSFASASVSGNTGLGIGSVPTVSIVNISGGGSLVGSGQRGLQLDATMTSASTSTYSGIQTQVRSSAAAYTCALAAGVHVPAASVGAGSTITRLANYRGDQPTGGTNNAFIADSNGFTGDFFLHQAGTDPSVLGGALGVAGTIGHPSLSTATLSLNGDAVALPTSGGRVVLYGSSHATRANDVSILAGADEVFWYDDSADQLNIEASNTGYSAVSATGNHVLFRNDANTAGMVLNGGNTGTTGGQVRVFGGAHASLANDVEFYAATDMVGGYDDSADQWNFNAPLNADQLLVGGSTGTNAAIQVEAHTLTGTNQMVVYSGTFTATSAATASIRGCSMDISSSGGSETVAFAAAYLGNIEAGGTTTITNAVNFYAQQGFGGAGTISHSAGLADSNNFTGGAWFINQTGTDQNQLDGTVFLMPNLPTSDPTNTGQLWNNSGVLTVSA